MQEKNQPELLDLWMREVFTDTIEYGEFIITQQPYPNYVETVSKLQIFKEKIEKRNLHYLSDIELDKLQNDSTAFVIGWNNQISTQSLKFYNAMAMMNNLKDQFLFDKKNNPFTKLTRDLERYKRAKNTIKKIFEQYGVKLTNEVEFYSIFFVIIAMAEAMEYYFIDFFERSVKDLKIKNIEISEIFSVTKQWCDEDGDYQPDIRMMRNALAHFNFTTEYKSPPDEIEITFFANPKGKEETRRLYSTDFLKFIGNYSNLLTNFEHITILMQTFALVNHYRIEDKLQNNKFG